MNPRDFCRHRSFDIAICLTYAFDALFFERAVLRDLWSGNSSEILVVADGARVQDAVSPGKPLRHLGRSYLLHALHTTACLHAKLLLRIGSEGALAWVGSNNLTFAGWGGDQWNRELATAWQITPGELSSVAWLRELLISLSKLVQGQARAIVLRALDFTWLASEGDRRPDGLRILLSFQKSTLAAQLLDIWKGRRFTKVKILTGSTDEKGAFIAWAAEAFGVREAIVALDPQRSAFRPKALQALPVRLSIIPLPSHPLPHAKLYWFEGSQGSGAVMGSANCSAAAWLLAPDRGGNIELVAVYDRPREKEFSSCLQPFEDAKPVWPSDVPDLGIAHMEPDRSTTPGYQLRELACSWRLGQLRATVSPPLGREASAEAVFDVTRVPLQRLDSDGGQWVGPLPDLTRGFKTHFGRIVFRVSGKSGQTGARWLDEDEEIQQASKGRHITNVIRGLSKPATKPSENAQRLRELAEIGAAIFNAKHFPDPPASAHDVQVKGNRESQPVDPDALVRSLTELPGLPAHIPAHASRSGLPLFGVMRALFVSEDEEDPEIGEPHSPGTDDRDKKREAKPLLAGSSTNEEEGPSEHVRKRFIQQTDRFLERLANPSFQDKCTAIQLVQAVSYPLAVAKMALKGRWIDPVIFSSWVIQVADILFRRRTGALEISSQAGLLGAVRQRYTTEGRQHVFDQIVGDGILWIALAVVLSEADWTRTNRGLERALTLRDVLEEKALIIHADASRLRVLVSQSSEGALRRSLLQEAGKAAVAANEVERLLSEHFEKLCEVQLGQEHRIGDPIWRPGVGFGVALEEAHINPTNSFRAYLRLRSREVRVQTTFYINVRLAESSSPRLARLLAKLAPCWPGHAETKETTSVQA